MQSARHPIKGSVNVNTLIFSASVTQINGWKIVRIPIDISQNLPSRGMVMVDARLNDLEFKIPLEPDGNGSHWFHIDDSMPFNIDEVIECSITSTKDWAEPTVPEDLLEALETNKIQSQWNSITVKARWEWIRWIRFTKNTDARKKRVETATSMLKSGKKRPCCFDQTRSTETHVSTSGKLDFPT